MQWSIDERFIAQAGPTDTYQIMHPPGQKFTVLHVKGALGSAATTNQLGEFDKLDQALDACEADFKKQAEVAPPAAAFALINTADLLKRYK